MLIGVDVGTGSARAGVFDAAGKLLGTGKHPVTLWQEPGEIVEQSSDQIWQAVCAAVREALATAAINPATITGIGFDATCSLVAIGDRGQSLPVGPSGDPALNVIVWMDHRAAAEAEARAVISGLGLDRGIDSLASLYLAGHSGIGYGLRQLLDRLQARGIAINTIVASGGAAQSALVCQMIADATGRNVALPEAAEPVLLGSAMLAAVAGGTCGTLGQAMTRMSGPARVFHPAKGDLARLHRDRYACFESLQTVARQFRQSQTRS